MGETKVLEMKDPQALARIRRLALTAQGLLQAQPYGRGLEGARKAIQHIGYVQIDTLSVVERAHNHVLYSRVPGFAPLMTNQMLLDGDIFEYWVHAAAFIPIADFRFSLPYKHAIKSGQIHWYRNPARKLMADLLAHIRSDGPVKSRDINTKAQKRAGWWDWKPAKKALEQLYMEGDLMIRSRDGFQKVYDLTERVLPSHINSQMPSMEEFAAHLLDQHLRCHGLVSMKGLTYQRRSAELRKAVKDLVNERLAQGTLEQVKLPSGEVFVLEAGALQRRLPPVKNRVVILSPFDNCVIQRERLKSLFQYDYQIECYVPAAKRQYGYFSLPFLFRDAFVGRMDCKADRKASHLEIKSLYLEQQCLDEDLLIGALIDAIAQFCRFQQCDSVSLTNAHPKHLDQRLRSALKSSG